MPLNDRFVSAGLFRIPGWCWGVLMLIGVLALGSAGVGSRHWNLGVGIGFSLLWISPIRAWPFLIAAGGFAHTVSAALASNGHVANSAIFIDQDFLYSRSTWVLFIGSWIDWLLCALPVAWLRQRVQSMKDALSLRGIGRLHVVAMAASTLMSLSEIKLIWFAGLLTDAHFPQVVDALARHEGNVVLTAGAFALKNWLGYFLGIMLVAPMTCWLVDEDLRRHSAPVLREAFIWLLPAALLFILLTISFPGGDATELLRLVLLASMGIFAVRWGWRGAVASIVVASVALAIEDHLGTSTLAPMWLQMFVALIGSMALLFGSSVDDLRRIVCDLAKAKEREQAMLLSLADAAARNVRVEEEERRRIAADLHDEVGQSLTAMQTQLKLSESEITTAQQHDHHLALRGLMATMRQSLRDVLEALRPAAIDELGLVRALENGSLRAMAEDAGITIVFDIRGEAAMYSALDDATRVAAYRIVQSAVTNVVRHADANRCLVRLRCAYRHGRLWLFIRIWDNGRGIPAGTPEGTGIRSMRDRALMLGGALRQRGGRDGGTCVRAVLRQG